MTESTPAQFEVSGPLPGIGVTVLEASAGTGKTYTIAALVTRYVAEGTPLAKILAITFTRMATGELRERVRERLVSAHAAVGRFVADGTPVPPDDELAALLVEGAPDEVEARRRRLADALTSFDEATITTTHGFCHLVLSSMGVAGSADADDQLLEDPSDLVEEIVDDLYLRRALGYGFPEFPRVVALKAAAEAIANPDVPLEPPADDSVPGRLRRFAEAARDEFHARLRRHNLLTYDELLLRLRNALADPERGATACAYLAGRYTVVLVDEFQDTDPVQWDIVSKAFGRGGTVVVLIGDPKQAIYAFRGADVYAYLVASASADRHFTLRENYRTDLPLLRAFDALMDPMLLGHPDIPYRRVRSISAHDRSGLQDAPSSAALRARVLHSDDHDVPLVRGGKLVRKAAAIQWVAEDLASDVVALLSSGAQLVQWDDQGQQHARRAITPGDMAVLVRTNHQAAVVHEALRAAGVPAVVASSGSVLEEAAAKEWLSLLEALEQPASRSRAVAVALGLFVGMSAERVASASETELEELHFRLRRLGQVLRHRGVAALFRAACIEGDVPARLLAHDGGERLMTDLVHVAELLGAEASFSQLGLPRLRAWLARRIAEATNEQEMEERTRRLDSDAQAIQILTVHRAKGLEFPIVYCPYVWDAGGPPQRETPVVFHDTEDEDRRKLDVASDDSPGYLAHAREAHVEERGEQLRHLYVALTRAKHQVVMWWARADRCQHSPLGRLLFSREADGTVKPEGRSRVPTDAEVSQTLSELSALVPGDISVERASGPTGDRWEAVHEGSLILSHATFDRNLDHLWRRTSYSAITAGAHDDLVGSEPESPGTVDEPAATAPGTHTGIEESSTPGTPSGDAGEPLQTACPLDQMPGGAEVGTVVHGVLELVDFSAADLKGELSEAVHAASARHGVALGSQELVVEGLASAIRTPLGPLTGESPLSEVTQVDRLDELAFELPVAGGEVPSGEVTMAALAQVLARHERPGDPLAGYAARLDDPMLERQFRGYLAGAIDMVLRRGAGPEARFFVIDYKSNRLAPPDEALLAWHYRPEALSAEMRRLHYPLQGLLYVVALHRYLRWRMPRYDPERNLGGVLYLFVRGMLGPDAPRVGRQPCGVFGWRPDADLVSELSDLLDAGVRVAESAAS